MKDKLVTDDMLYKQLEEVLEERQNPDRRKGNKELPENVMQDRRKDDRRSRKEKK